MLALILATACLVAVLARLVLTFAQNLRDAGREPRGGDDGRADRPRQPPAARPRSGARRAPRWPRASGMLLALFDLNGFKQYNDSFGHPAGDALLVRLGASLRRAMEGSGTAYRMGGDEFCILAPLGDEGAERITSDRGRGAAARRARASRSRCAYGAVVLPDDADDADDAVRLADRRMYAQKNGGRTSASSQSKDVLLQALLERNPELGEHLERRRRARRGDRAEARPGRRIRRAGAHRRGAARRRQGRHPRRDPQQARTARRRRVGVRPPALGDRRADRRRRPGARRGRAARALDARALGRHRLPRPPRRATRSRSAPGSSRSATPTTR